MQENAQEAISRPFSSFFFFWMELGVFLLKTMNLFTNTIEVQMTIHLGTFPRLTKLMDMEALATRLELIRVSAYGAWNIHSGPYPESLACIIRSPFK